MTTPLPLCERCAGMNEGNLIVIFAPMHECGNPGECRCPGRRYRLVKNTVNP